MFVVFKYQVLDLSYLIAEVIQILSPVSMQLRIMVKELQKAKEQKETFAVAAAAAVTGRTLHIDSPCYPRRV